MNNTQPPAEKEWEKEFEKEWDETFEFSNKEIRCVKHEELATPGEMKDFISRLLSDL